MQELGIDCGQQESGKFEMGDLDRFWMAIFEWFDLAQVVSGVLCLHMTNYKLILVDKTDWMYVQLSDCLDSAKVLSSQHQHEPREPLVLLHKHLLKPISIRRFNVVIESLDLHDVAVSQAPGESLERKIFYIQADLKFFQLVTNKDDELAKLMSLSERPVDLKEGIWTSLVKARKLEDIFLTNSTAKSIYAEFERAAREGVRLTKDDLKRLGKHIYLFRVVSKENVKMLLNSQHRNKLRGDLIVEIKDLFQAPTFAALLALMSSSLYHYNFLHVNRFYLLISNEPVQFQPDSKSWPSSIIFLGDQFTLVDQQMIIDSLEDCDGHMKRLRGLQPASRTSNSPRNLKNQDYVQSFTGTLLSKQLMVNQSKNQIDPVQNSQLMNHFDVLFANREFRLQIELEESVLDNIDKFFDSLCGQDKMDDSVCLDRDDSIITVYFDHMFSLFELSVLPGMQIQLSNLIKRSNRVFRSNSTLKSIYSQPFDFLQVPADLSLGKSPDTSISYSPLSSPKPSKLPHPLEFLYTTSKIFSVFYTNDEQRSNRPKPRQSFDAVRLQSLFKLTDGPSSHASSLTVLGQITKFYHLNLRLCCSECARFASSCTCGKRNFRVELDTSFQIDDHTSWLRVNYTSANYDLESKEHSIFAPIAKNLLYLLTNYVNEISLPTVPMQFFVDQNNEQNRQSKSACAERLA